MNSSVGSASDHRASVRHSVNRNPADREILDAYRHHFCLKPHKLFVTSARISLDGEHLDYVQEFLSKGTLKNINCAIDCAKLKFASARTHDGVFTLKSAQFPDRQYRASVDDQEVNGVGPLKYLQAALLAMKHFKLEPINGANLFVGGEVPNGASSSAAFLVGIIGSLSARFVRQDEMVDIARFAENLTGLRCGILDYEANTAGLENQLTVLDLKTRDKKHLSFPQGISIMVILDPTPRQLAGTSYNQLVAQAQSISDKLGDFLDLSKDELEPLIQEKGLTSQEANQCHFIWSENQRVSQLISILETVSLDADRADIAKKIRNILHQTHLGMDSLGVSTSRWNAVAEASGGRGMGGGGGGCVVTVAADSEIDEIEARVRQTLQEEFKEVNTEILVCRPSNGIKYMELV